MLDDGSETVYHRKFVRIENLQQTSDVRMLFSPKNANLVFCFERKRTQILRSQDRFGVGFVVKLVIECAISCVGISPQVEVIYRRCGRDCNPGPVFQSRDSGLALTGSRNTSQRHVHGDKRDWRLNGGAVAYIAVAQQCTALMIIKARGLISLIKFEKNTKNEI
jgi:hypothetical protein